MSAESKAKSIEREWLVAGRVQGVAFRAFARSKAYDRNVLGYVENLADGRVRAVGMAAPDTLKQFAVHLQQGPPAARVESLTLVEHASRANQTANWRDFSIR